MMTQPLSLRMTRNDVSRNMARFYFLSLQPTLFGEVMLIRNWGRIGTAGQTRFETFSEEEAASVALHRLRCQKMKKGYCAD